MFETKRHVQSAEKVNPLQPYYLVYIRNNGEVRFSYAQPKQILEMFRLLCAGRKEYYEDLCSVFNNETREGGDMAAYSELMKKTVSNIATLLGKRNELQLDGRGGKLIDETDLPKAENDFELITWLIIK